MTEQELLLDCVRRLNRNKVCYMLTGSMASNAWGIPRTTHDLDFVIQLLPSQTGAFVNAFAGPDYFVDEQAIRAAFQAPFQFNVIHIPSALKADFWMLKSEKFEQMMFNRRIETTWLGERIWIATAEDVILHKLYWNGITPSERQLSDAAGVLAVQAEKLDVAYLKQWADELHVTAELEDLFAGRIRPKHT